MAAVGPVNQAKQGRRIVPSALLIASQADTGRAGLDLLVLLDVPAHFAPSLAGALLVLFLVLHLELGEVEGKVFSEQIAAVAGVLHARDQDVRELDLEVFQRLLAGLADGDQGFLDVLAVTAGQHQSTARLVHELGDGDVVNGDLAGAAAAAGAVSAGLVHAPAKGLDVNLVLVLGVLRFSLDPIDLQKHVNGHGGVLLHKASRLEVCSTFTLDR